MRGLRGKALQGRCSVPFRRPQHPGCDCRSRTPSPFFGPAGADAGRTPPAALADVGLGTCGSAAVTTLRRSARLSPRNGRRRRRLRAARPNKGSHGASTATARLLDRLVDAGQVGHRHRATPRDGETPTLIDLGPRRSYGGQSCSRAPRQTWWRAVHADGRAPAAFVGSRPKGQGAMTSPRGRRKPGSCPHVNASRHTQISQSEEAPGALVRQAEEGLVDGSLVDADARFVPSRAVPHPGHGPPRRSAA